VIKNCTYKIRHIVTSIQDRHPFNGFFFEDNLGKLTPEGLNDLDFNEARDDGVAVASAGTYANHLHLSEYR